MAADLTAPFARDPELPVREKSAEVRLQEEVEHHEAARTARKLAMAGVTQAGADVYIAGEDPEADLRESTRAALLHQEEALEDFLATASKLVARAVEEAARAKADGTGDPASSGAAEGIDPAKILQEGEGAEMLAEVRQRLDEMKAAFEGQYGESVYKQRLDRSVPDPRDVDPHKQELQRMGYPLEASREARSVKRNIATMDDTLVRRIEAHLAGTTLPSLDFGHDQGYLDEKQRRDGQVFDEAGWEAL